MRLLRLVLPLAAMILGSATADAQRVPTRPPTKRAPAKDSSATTPAPTTPRPPAPVEAAKLAYLHGVALDSLHSVPLANATVEVEGTGRIAFTDSLGRFLLDSIPPGRYRLVLDHPMLDTIGLSLASDTLTFVTNDTSYAALAVPAGERLVELFCPPARRLLGPGAMVGRVREPDTDEPALGARVSLVWEDPGLPGMPAILRTRRQNRVREATVAGDGTYRICGLPRTFEGKLQAQRKDGGATAEVAVSQADGVLTLRSLSVAALPKLAGTDSASLLLRRGSARVTGRVLNAGGLPIAGARVGLMGVSAATQTRANGDFVLDSLPSGTQSLVVRQIGYRPTEVPVELSARAPAHVTVQLGVYVPELAPVKVIATREAGLQAVGFADRKKSGLGGTFIDTEAIERLKAGSFTDLLRTVPGIRVEESSGNQKNLVSTRSVGTGTSCVTVFVDGAPWQQLQTGDLDGFIQPAEVAAIEVYHGTFKPGEFTTPGQDCAAVVVWTKTRVQSARRR